MRNQRSIPSYPGLDPFEPRKEKGTTKGGKKMTTMLPSENAEEKMVTVIAEDLHIKGTITFKTSLMIKGSLEGEIISEGMLVVGPTAKIDATITTKSLVSHGVIQGDVTASEQVVLKGTAIHTGKITTPNIMVESGSVFNGSCVMKREKPEASREEMAADRDDPPGASLEQESPAEEPPTQTGETIALLAETAEPSAQAETPVEMETASPSESKTGQFEFSRRGSGKGKGYWPANGK
jgi:cytoskeletal protein CcmA (bactofilin family)